MLTAVAGGWGLTHAAVCASRTGALNRFVVTGPRAHALLQTILDVEAPPTGTDVRAVARL